MSGIVGHTLFGILGLKAAIARKLPAAAIAAQHQASYLAGAYLGSDIQTMPEAVCVESGREVGYGTVPLEKSPVTGGPVRPWSLTVAGRNYRPREIHELFYGRSHVVFGWPRQERELAVPWDHLPDYFAAVVEDTYELFGSARRPLAYVLGWMVHVVSDSLIKSVQPGIDLDLLDGKYTPRNRPIQDLFMYHEIGVKEFHLDWPALLADLVETPVEGVQFHYMRIAEPRGQLGRYFPHDWRADQRELLSAGFAAAAGRSTWQSLKVMYEAPVAAPNFSTLGTAETVPGFRLNSGGARRSVSDAVALARKHGVVIADDIEFVPTKVGDMTGRGNRAEYLQIGDRGTVQWSDFYGVNNKIIIRVRQSQFLSDEAIVTTMAHEMHEINALREIFDQAGGSLPNPRVFSLINKNARQPNGTVGGVLHQEAQQAERSVLSRMRSGE